MLRLATWMAVLVAVSTGWKMQTIRSIQARVQNSPPLWNATMGRWVGNFAGSDPYISPMDTMTTSSVEGALQYIQSKLTSGDPNCTRNKNMSSIWIYDINVVQPPASVALFGTLSAQVLEYGLFVDMISGSCVSSTGTIPDECRELANKSDAYYGPYVGATVKQGSDYGDYNDTVWFSYPNSCVLEKYADKTAECRAVQPGGLCPLGVAPDGVNCTFNYTILGHIPLDDLVGITNMTFKNDSTRYYKDRTEFCKDGRIEYRVNDQSKTTESDLEFWKDGLNQTANSVRSRKLIDFYNTFRNKTNMVEFPSIGSLRANNPPCYVNSPRCASTKYGCSRTLLAQVCQVCTSANDTLCVAKPPNTTIMFPSLEKASAPPSTTITAAPSPAPTEAPSSVSTGAIIGIVLGCLAAAGLVFYAVRRRQTAGRRPSKWSIRETTMDTTKFVDHMAGGPTDDADDDVNLEGLELLRLDNSKLLVNYLIGTGAFSGVWHGSYDNEPVAVKKLHPNKVTHRHIQAFAYEISLMGSFDSPYIVRCFGATWTDKLEDLTCVMEYMDSADLRAVLARTTPETLPWKDKLSFMTHMIGGLGHLHARNVIHRDFKSRNLLVDSRKGLKLTDFGSSREEIEATMTVGVGTFRWMAPEVIQGHQYSVAADIYSFGMTLVELDTHKLPYQNMKNPATGLLMTDTSIVLAVGQGAIQPTFSDICPDWIRTLALQCIAVNPEIRPTADQIRQIIQSQVERYNQ
ncbi:hypothetical protein AeMF1_003455 [Aphanomyces euteiches]|nr:hypothetical protein AeMF1_003455 [Aphanomyces euteiches]